MGTTSQAAASSGTGAQTADRALLSFTQIHSLPPNVVRLLTAVRPLGFDRFFRLRERAN